MPSLAETQSGFARALCEAQAPPPAGLSPPPVAGRSRRFDVHRNNRASSLIDALQACFPAVRRLVGDDFFRAAARAYVGAEPPRSPVLLHYGGTFAAFLAAFPPAAPVPYLGDVARLEWARQEALHARDAAPAGIERLAELAPEEVPRARLGLHPSLGLLRSPWPVVSLWSASAGGGADGKVDLRRAEEALVLRPRLRVLVRALPPGAFEFIRRLRGGATIARAAGGCAGGAPEAFPLSSRLRGLFDAGAVVSVSVPQPEQHPDDQARRRSPP